MPSPHRSLSPLPGKTYAEEYLALSTALDQAAALKAENASLRELLERAERRAANLDKRVHQLLRMVPESASGPVHRNPVAVSINTRPPVGQLGLVAGVV